LKEAKFIQFAIRKYTSIHSMTQLKRNKVCSQLIKENLFLFMDRKWNGQKFIDLARSVYLNNDKRSEIKLKINKILNSNIKEIKHYVDY